MPATSKRAEEHLKIKRKRSGQLMKLIGTGFLLASFISQNFLYDKWDGEQKFTSDAIQKNLLEMQSSALNEMLYFELDRESVGDPIFNNQIKLAKLRKAALAYASSVNNKLVLTNSKDFAQFDQLESAAQNISDYRSYIDYRRSFDKLETTAMESLARNIFSQEQKRRETKWAYLASYILGALLALFGEILIYRFGD
jgi:hypothetical protein